MIFAKILRVRWRWNARTQRQHSQLRLGSIVLTTKARQEMAADRHFSAGADVALRLGFNPIAEKRREDAGRERRSHLRAV